MNSQAFTPKEVEQGLLQDLINYLLDYNNKNKDSYNDIHITSDGYCTIVEWINTSYNYEGKEDTFINLKNDEYVMKELIFPDSSSEYVFPEEAKERLNEWYKDNPEWVEKFMLKK